MKWATEHLHCYWQATHEGIERSSMASVFLGTVLTWAMWGGMGYNGWERVCSVGQREKGWTRGHVRSNHGWDTDFQEFVSLNEQKREKG